jgi:hypothetical protein
MPFPRPVDSTLHGVVDYTAGTFLLTAFPRLAGIGGTRSARQIRIAAAIQAGYGALTRYPLGIIKLLPFQVHLALDAAGAVALAAMPFATGQYTEGRKQWLPQVALGLFELSSLAITDPTGRGDYHGDVAKIHEANMEDPRRKIYEGPPAVVASAARAHAA